MFCEKCGTKNQVGAKFCEKCGAAMAVVNEVPVVTNVAAVSNKPKIDVVATVKNAWGKVTRKQKMLGLLVIIVLALIGGGYYVGNSLTSPEKMMEGYLAAFEDYDFGKLYDYLDVEKNAFTTKEMYEKVMEVEDKDDLPDFKWKITKTTIDDDTAKVKVKITDKDSDDDYKFNVKLVQSGKKFLLFPNWKVDANKLDDADSYVAAYLGFTVKDFKITVLKGSTVTIEEVELTDEFLDDDASDDEYDVYEIPEMFAGTYDVKVEFPFGAAIEDEMEVSEWETYYSRTSFSMSDLSAKQKEALAKRHMELLQGLYDNAIAGKTFADVEATYKVDGIDMEDLKEDYEEFVSDLSDNYYRLTELTLSNPELDYIYVGDDGTINVEIQVDFVGKTQYTYSDGDVSVYDEKGTNYYQGLYLKYVDGQYHLAGIDYIDTYF